MIFTVLAALAAILQSSGAIVVMCLSLMASILAMAGVVGDYPGVYVTEATAGAIPIERVGFNTAKFVGTALRGPTN